MLSNKLLFENCKQFTGQNNIIWIGYSGGVDSHVLLHLASQSLPNVHAVHVHHGLSPNADAWLQHCAKVCDDLNVNFTSLKVNAKPTTKQSPEDAARIARRTAWKELLGAEDILLLAQHAEDQAETILYRLFRGTGPHGLSGMQEISILGKARVFRPLLNTSKQEILRYAQQHSLQWITDESNVDQRYDRNFIRNAIMPLVQQRWPAATESINRAGKLSGQLSSCLLPLVQDKLYLLFDPTDNSLCLSQLKQQTNEWQIELLRAWLRMYKCTAQFKQLESIISQVINCRNDAMPEFILDNLIIRRSKNKLYILPSNTNSQLASEGNNVFSQAWDLATDLQLPNGDILSKQSLDMPAELLSLICSQQVVVKLGTHGKKAKKIFQDLDIPSWQRRNFPVLFVNDRLIGIVGLWWSKIRQI